MHPAAPPYGLMPAKRKTTHETAATVQRLFRAYDEWQRNERDVWPPRGMEQTPGFTLGGMREQYRNDEPVVWVLARSVRAAGTATMEDADPLVTSVWDT